MTYRTSDVTLLSDIHYCFWQKGFICDRNNYSLTLFYDTGNDIFNHQMKNVIGDNFIYHS